LLKKIIENPPKTYEEFILIKKDIFHAFHMIPITVDHGLRKAFLRALRDHLMRWDPSVRAVVNEACQKFFKLSFDQMLVRNPRFIAARTPRYVPPPSVIVPAIQHVYKTFGNAPDAKTGLPLFSAKAWKKANAVLELAREGYLSDVKGVVLYEKAGIDKYGLQKYKCLRGTNKVEGGPHGDIYRKFGALHGKYSHILYTNFRS
jgi:CRISPR-associated Cas5-like protein